MYDADTADSVIPKTKPDPFKFEKLAEAYIEDRYGRGEFPLYYNGRTYHYTGTHYVVEPEPDHAIRTWMRRAKKGQSNNVVGNVRPVVESYCRKSVSQYPDMPFYCGTEAFPEPRNIIAYTNGMLNLSSLDAELSKHTPKWCSTSCLPFDFNPAATCPLWLQFLADVFEEDKDRVSQLQEWFGYCLTSDTSLQKAMVQVGKARSGKGVTQRILQSLIGKGNWTAYTLPQLATEFGMSPLDGAQVAFVGEVELSGHPMRNVILERLKGIIGEDAVILNEKYEKPRSVKLQTRFFVSCNEMPTFYDASGAIGQRFLYLHYQKSVAGREDRTLELRLSGELSGINNWALTGLARLRSNGGVFTVPDTAVKLSRDFLLRSNPIHQFVADKLIVNRQCDPGDVPGVELTDKPVVANRDVVFKAYETWCTDHDIEMKTLGWFCRDLSNALPKLQDNRQTVNGVRVRVYVGVSVKAAKTETGPDPLTVFRWVSGAQFKVRGLSDDITGTPITTLDDGSVRMRFAMDEVRFAALPDDVRDRLRPSASGGYLIDVPPDYLVR